MPVYDLAELDWHVAIVNILARAPGIKGRNSLYAK